VRKKIAPSAADDEVARPNLFDKPHLSEPVERSAERLLNFCPGSLIEAGGG
jgi:hypothetical protein